MIAAGVKKVLDFILSPGNSHDAPNGRLLMEVLGKQKQAKPIIMDRAYEDDKTRYIAQSLGRVATITFKLYSAISI